MKTHHIRLPWLRINLSKFHLVGGNRLSISIEDEKSSARSALVDRAHEGTIRGLHVRRNFLMLSRCYIVRGISGTIYCDNLQLQGGKDLASY